MGKKALIIVESPAKMKTLKKFLGSGYSFDSSVGHIRDLPEKGFGIDIENDFTPTYEVVSGKEELVRKLKKAAKEADIVYLCPDPDREGEAIAWHISELLPKGVKYKRASFNAITKEEVRKALDNPRDIDMALVDAQQARRLLDRIVGYKISPLLARRLQGGGRSEKGSALSAGRVQSVALKLVVDREKEILAFIPVEYWNLSANLEKDSDGKSFTASLYSVEGKKVEKESIEGKEVFLIPNEQVALDIQNRLLASSFTIQKVERKEKKRNPVPPFITSTLQQEVSRHFGFSATRTMSIAQSLYEGLDLGNEGTEGLITYMRTDSVRIAPEAIEQTRTFIKQRYGEDYLSEKPKIYSSSKAAQDAHEAIRPTNLYHTPESIAGYLSPDQLKLYTLIWRRAIASQMSQAIYDTVSVQVAASEDMELRASGSVLKFPGFLAIYEEQVDDDDKGPNEKLLPDLEEGQALKLLEAIKEQAFTKPPPRFTEASLVKELEKSGIGRPSTYASIMNKIQSRAYTTKENKQLRPTELGMMLAPLLEEHFPQIMNISFTKEMEDELENVSDSKKEWKTLIKEFWKDFAPAVENAEQNLYAPKEMTDHICPKCKKQLQKIWAKGNYFFGCSGYPDCDYRASQAELEFDKSQYAEDFDWEQSCPKCHNPMVIRHGRYGTFLGCSKYPECNGIVNVPKKGEKAIDSSPQAPCPATGCEGHLIARKSRFGKIFYGCSTYPDCSVIGNSVEEAIKKYKGQARTPHVKPTKAKGSKGKKVSKKGAALKLSKELEAIVGKECSTRGQITKNLWAYIKEQDLQDPKDKRQILPDDKLSKVLGKESCHMMSLAKHIGKHIER